MLIPFLVTCCFSEFPKPHSLIMVEYPTGFISTYNNTVIVRGKLEMGDTVFTDCENAAIYRLKAEGVKSE